MGIPLDIVTIVIMVACVLVSLKGFKDLAFFNNYKFWIAGINNGEQYRFFTSAFLHANVQHLAFNMITLYFFAAYVVKDMGSTGFIAVYLAGLFAGNYLSYLLHKNEYHYSAIGASGAVMAIVYSGILLEPDLSIYFIPGYLFGAGYLFYTLYGMKVKKDNIGHDAHFGGAVAGYIVTLAYDFQILFEQSLTVGLMALPIVALFVLKKLGQL